MDHPHIAEVLGSACTPLSLFNDDYDTFLKERSALLLEVANGLAQVRSD